MKAFNKDDIRRRFDNSSIKPYIKVEDVNHPIKLHRWELNKVLTIIIPGNPLADSRPRHKKDYDFFYNPHLANGVKLLKEVFDRVDPDRKNDILIEGPIISEIDIYLKPSDSLVTTMDTNSYKDYKNEILPNPTNKKDIDNIEKLWWDCMGKFNIILLDEFICKNISQKFYTYDESRERLEIRFYFTDKDTFPARYLRTLKEYFKYSLTLKYKRLNNIRDDLWQFAFYKNVATFYTKYKGKMDTKAIQNVLSEYKIDQLQLFSISGTRDKIIKEVIKNCERIFNEIRTRKKRGGKKK